MNINYKSHDLCINANSGYDIASVQLFLWIYFIFFFQLKCCKDQTSYSCFPSCSPCLDYLMDNGLDTLKNGVGGIGLFFSFMMVRLVVLHKIFCN